MTKKAATTKQKNNGASQVKKPEEQKVSITITVSPKLAKILAEESAENYRSIASTVRMVLEETYFEKL